MATVPSTHSAVISGQVIVGNHSFPLWQMGPDFCTVREACAVEPSEARIVLRVDDETYEYDVFLSEGIIPGVSKTPFTNRRLLERD